MYHTPSRHIDIVSSHHRLVIHAGLHVCTKSLEDDQTDKDRIGWKVKAY